MVDPPPDTNREQLRLLLQDGAQLLAREGAVESPAHVAIVKYDPKLRLNKYFLLYDDWGHLATHPLHVQSEWNAKYVAGFHTRAFWRDRVTKSTRQKVRQKKFHDRLNWFQNEIRIRPQKCEQLAFIVDELKKVSFYCPLTEIVYEEAQRAGRKWGFIPLSDLHNVTDPYYLERQREREKVETSAKCLDDWHYGVELEALYLNAYNCQYYAEYFLRKTTDADDYIVVACCHRESDAEKIHLLESVVKKTGFDDDPFRSLSLEIERIKRDLTTNLEIPTDAERTKLINYKSLVQNCQDSQLLRALLDKKNLFHNEGGVLWPSAAALSSYDELTRRSTTPN